MRVPRLSFPQSNQDICRWMLIVFSLTISLSTAGLAQESSNSAVNPSTANADLTNGTKVSTANPAAMADAKKTAADPSNAQRNPSLAGEPIPEPFMTRPAPPLITTESNSTPIDLPVAFLPGQSNGNGPVDLHTPMPPPIESKVQPSGFDEDPSAETPLTFSAPESNEVDAVEIPQDRSSSEFDEYESDYFKDTAEHPADEEDSIYSMPRVEASLSPDADNPYGDSELYLTPPQGNLPADSLRNIVSDAKPVDAPGAWWDDHITHPLRHSAEPRRITLSGLIHAALQYSSRVRVISESPLIQDTAIVEADAAFDWAAFVETQWQDIDEPVGSTLTTGGPPRFQDEIANFELGARRRNLRGGDFSISQQYGYERSNSVFFIPQDQGTARLTLNYTQPLLRNGGKLINTSQIVLAQIQSGAARDVFSRDLQAHLFDVTEAYWNLFLERGLLLQRQRLYKRGQLILKDLEVREQLDAVANQIVRARAAVASRRSDLFRAAAGVKNAEGRIRALVNAPGLGIVDEFELTPMDFPATYEIPLELHDALQAAFRNRPEIREALKQVRAGALRLNVSQNELLPILDLTLESYMNGLRGDSDIGGAWVDQFGDGAPSYTAGLRFEVPIGNRAARARFQRRALELRQLEHQFRNTLQVLQLDVEIAVRETLTAYREIEAKRQALRAAESEVDFLTQRWELMPGEDRSTSLLLEDLLAAQERLAQQEFEYLNAQVQYNISIVNLKKSTGTLLQFEQVNVGKSEVEGIPELHLYKQDANVIPAGAAMPISTNQIGSQNSYGPLVMDPRGSGQTTSMQSNSLGPSGPAPDLTPVNY